MTDMPAAYREQLARIDCQREDARKFAGVLHMLIAEDIKLNRGRLLARVRLLVAALVGFAAGAMGTWGLG